MEEHEKDITIIKYESGRIGVIFDKVFDLDNLEEAMIFIKKVGDLFYSIDNVVTEVRYEALKRNK